VRGSISATIPEKGDGENYHAVTPGRIKWGKDPITKCGTLGKFTGKTPERRRRPSKRQKQRGTGKSTSHRQTSEAEKTKRGKRVTHQTGMLGERIQNSLSGVG